MDNDEFRAYMKKKRRSQSATETCIQFSEIFEKYLEEFQEGIQIETATHKDLSDFIVWGKKEFRSVNSHLWALTRV